MKILPQTRKLRGNPHFTCKLYVVQAIGFNLASNTTETEKSILE